METSQFTSFPAAFLAFTLATVAVRVLISRRFADAALDIPNERSSHSVPVPRTGGLGLMSAAMVSWLVLAGGAHSAAVLPAAALTAISFADDAHGLSVRLRLALQALAALVFLGLAYTGPIWLAPLALITLIWMANLYNFMDGSDGLAGGMALLGFGAYAYAAADADQPGLALTASSLAGAAAGFLVWNFHKARIFMGDSGSIPLGFLAAALGIIGWQHHAWPVWLPPLVFSPFIADATTTLYKRWARGERLSEAHRSHYYQRVLRMGAGHRGTALGGYALMLAAAISALSARDWHWPGVTLLLAAWVALYALILRAIDRRWALFEAAQANPAPGPLSAL